jgi:hypothetical protein
VQVFAAPFDGAPEAVDLKLHFMGVKGGLVDLLHLMLNDE